MSLLAQNMIPIGGSGGEEASALVSYDEYWIAGGIFQQTLLGNPSRGQFDIWLHQYDSVGTLQWEYYIGSQRNDNLGAIAIQENTGDWYTTGDFSDSLYLGVDTILYSNNNTLFVTKHNQAGQLLWAKKIASNNLIRVEDIVVDKQGNSYLTGSFRDSLQADTVTLVHNGIDDAVFLLKLDQNGKTVWGAQSRLATNAIGKAIAIGEAQAVYLTGDFSSFLSLVGDTLLSGWVDPDIFLAKLDSNGNWLWQRQYMGSYPDRATALVYGQGKLYLGGSFEGVLTLDDNQPLVTANRAYDAFIAQMDTVGNVIWSQQTLSENNCFLEDLVWQADQLVAVGSFEERFVWSNLAATTIDQVDGFQLVLSTDGQQAALQTFSGGGNDIAKACAISRTQKVGVVGSFQQQLDIGTNMSLSAQGFSDGFLYWQAPQDLTVSVLQPTLLMEEIRIFPNPTTQLIYLESTLELVEWKLYTTNGTQILQGQTQIVNLQDIPRGIYYIMISTTTKKQIFKIIKQD